MIDMKTKVIYRAFGLSVISDFPLTELSSTKSNGTGVDVAIKRTDLSTLWNKMGNNNDYFVIKRDFILFNMPKIATFLIKDGKEIFVSPSKDNPNKDLIGLYILGTCMGALLMQRRILPLHGSAIEVNGKVYAIVGKSGAGKSTLATAFLKKGHQLLSDDIIPVKLSPQHVPYVIPSYPQQKLWQGSLDEFGIASDGLRPIIDRETKFAVPVVDQFSEESLPLAGVIELSKANNENIELQPIHSLQRLHTLFVHTYRNFFINKAGLMEWHFNTTTQMTNKVNLFQLKRPVSRFTTDELTEIILETIKKEEKVYGSKSSY